MQKFFSTVRPLFGGRLTQGQVDGMNAIVEYAKEWGYSQGDTAYILSTAFHETAQWMEPIREGARRYGTSYSDAAAKRAVASIHAKGIIRTNYALPAGPYGQSYYGRGYVQITWYDNYRKFSELFGPEIDLEREPDQALEVQVALDILFLGMRDGMFTGKKLSDYSFPAQFKQARVIVNGDSAKKWGGSERIDDKLARYAGVFYNALEGEL